MRTASKRECPNCKRIQNTYYGCDVMVVPHYKSRVRVRRDPLTLNEHYDLVITEMYICPNCGEKIIEEYIADFTQEDMQTMVDRKVAKRS